MAGAGAVRAGRAFVELFADDTMLIRTLRRAEARVRRFGTNIHNIGKQLGTLGLALSAPFAASVKVFADFDDTLRAVKGVTSATADEFDMLTDKAKTLGRTTSFTTHQVAEAMLQLGRAGFAPKEIDNSIASILNLSRATRTDLAESARIASASLRAFDLDASEMPRVCDVMVAAANNSAQTLEDLGFSMSYCAPIAQQYGMSIEETCKAIGALSNYGIKASQAGTTFRRILVNLADKRVQRQLRNLGVEIQDKDTGKMRNASAILKDLGKAMRFMSESQQISLTKDLFGVWAMAGSAKLTIAQFDRLYDAIDNATGIAQKVAKEMDSGIGGSLRMLWSAVETVAITIGETLAPALKKITDFWTKAASGLVVYLSHNRELIVQFAKVVASILAVGAGLVGLGMGMLAVSKMLVIVASTLSTVGVLLSLPLNMVAKMIFALRFAASAVISVFARIGSVIASAATIIAATCKTVLSVLAGLASVALSAVLGIGKALWTLATGFAGALGILFRGISIVVSGIVPIVASAISLLGGMVAGLTGIVLRVVTGMASAFAALFPVVISGISAMLGTLSFAFTAIAAGCSAAFASIAIVVKAAFISVGAMIVSVLQTVFSVVASVAASLFVPIISVVGGMFSALAGLVISAATAVVSTVVSLVTAIGAAISAAVTTAVTFIVVQFAAVVGLVTSFIGHFVAALGVAVAGVLSALSPILIVMVTIAAAVAGVWALCQVLGGVGNIIATLFQKAVSVVSSCVSWIGNFIVTMGGYILLGFVDCISAIITATWNMARQVGSIVATAAGAAISAIQSTFSAAWSGLVSAFSAFFSTLGQIVTSFGSYFITVFAQIGTAIDWAKEKFGQLCSFATETYGAIVAALGRGDIEAAIQLVWASIKLIWTQGTVALVSAWYWVTETLQTAWATCVFKISELLTTAWFGVQEFWTETVYTMQTLWIGFSNTVISAWKKAEESIAQGIGYIIAKMEGLDPNQLAANISEDYNRQAKQREAEKSQAKTDVQNNRDKKMASLKTEKDDTLGILRSDFEASGKGRDTEYEAKISAQQKELDVAKAAYNDAITKAQDYSPWNMNTRTPNEDAVPSVFSDLQNKVQDAVKSFSARGDLGQKVSVSGSFSAAAIAAMGQGTVMDRVAKATEKSEKHLAKMAEQNGAKDSSTKKPPEKEPVKNSDEHIVAKELKQHTRYLRDMARGGRVFA